MNQLQDYLNAYELSDMHPSDIAKILKTLDDAEFNLKISMFNTKTFKLNDDDIVLLKALNGKFKDVVGLVNYMARNQSELSAKTS